MHGLFEHGVFKKGQAYIVETKQYMEGFFDGVLYNGFEMSGKQADLVYINDVSYNDHVLFRI